MRDRIVRFLRDQICYSILYFLAIAMILLFYKLTTTGVKIVYPICIALFFYAIGMVIRFIQYDQHEKTMKKLSKNLIELPRANKEYEYVYNQVAQVHKEYQSQVASLKHKYMEDIRLLSAFVHNLKTPVTVSNLVVQRGLSEELDQTEALEQIREELDRLNSGLNNLLDLERLNEAEKDFEPERLDLAKEVTKVINANKSLFIYSHVYPKFSEESCYVYTDRKWNQVLIHQIISNAVKYSKGSETHYIYFQIQRQNDHCILTIQDEGIGIPDYDLPRVFEPFFTGENGRKGYNSSGIGLYLCKRICDMLNQNIQIENENGCKVSISYLSKM